jgi:hypothetical protein
LQHLVHQPLKRLAAVAQPEGHARILEQAKRRDDCRLANIGWMHWYLMVTLF